MSREGESREVMRVDKKYDWRMIESREGSRERE